MGAASELEGPLKEGSLGLFVTKSVKSRFFHAAPIDVRNHGVSKERLLWLAQER